MFFSPQKDGQILILISSLERKFGLNLSVTQEMSQIIIFGLFSSFKTTLYRVYSFLIRELQKDINVLPSIVFFEPSNADIELEQM